MFPPIHWHYNKIICGSKESKYDFEYISKFNFECWNKIINNHNFTSINIDKYIVQLCEQHVQYEQTGLINFHELHDLIEELNKILNNNEFFLRLSYRSTKDVAEGRMPITNANQIITAIIKSERCFDDMVALLTYNNDNQITNSLFPLYIHLVPWRNCDWFSELRCFIFEKKLVAISNQSDNWLFKGRELEIVYKINKFVNELYQKHKDLYDSTVMDIELTNDFDIILIEFNPYYEKGSTGAIFFNWNEKLLVDDNPKFITLRYCNDKSKEQKIDYKSLY